jgi:hypothetical protein|tara:strand:- start:258 stop:383 length:126 start_codon:yes stop_codon:yes gene_type:complete
MNKKQKERLFVWIAKSIRILNIILVIGFLVYLYFWVKAQGG